MGADPTVTTNDETTGGTTAGIVDALTAARINGTTGVTIEEERAIGDEKPRTHITVVLLTREDQSWKCLGKRVITSHT